VPPFQALNTAVSFVTNTNWQSYSGEQVMGNLVQMAGLAVQNFLSAAVGMAVAVALVRGFARERAGGLGNFWADLVRGTFRILLPLAAVATVLLIAGGVVQNLADPQTVTTLAGGAQTIPGGPVATQEAIKELGTNGGGFFNANSAHPFENPQAWTNLLQVFLILVIPFSLTRTFGRMVGDVRQGYAILAVMGGIWLAAVTATLALQMSPGGTALQAAGAATEGQEVRFGVPASGLFAVSTTMTSTGAVDSAHSSYSPLGGGITLVNMMLGEVTPGGTGSGLYGLLILAVVAVFLAGLMVGRTPEYLRKRIGAQQIKLVALYVLATPTLVLAGTGLAMASEAGRSSIFSAGPHGFSEVLYAFTSASNNNGSAFAGLSANTDFYNIALAVCMALGRFVPIALVLALAGSLARQAHSPVTEGTLPTHRPLFVVLLAGSVVVLTALTYFPALALGPLAEGLS
jgi:potassium-transporting ATPase potassium-binding subunit